MGELLRDIADAYGDQIVDAGKQPQLFLIVAFVLTFGIVRSITHAIRSQRFPWLGNVEVGATHVHHLVFGIFLLLITGYMAVALDFFPSRELLAVMFGIGAALTLDEFALWLNLEDVYWSPQGRRSVEAVIVAASGALLVLVGVHFWLALADEAKAVYDALFATLGTTGLVLSLICLLKGKFASAVIGLFVPLVSLVGALRLARPTSWWARRYQGGKRARAEERFRLAG